jgi:hypothetical protein
MSARPRQGSASFVIVLGAVAMFLVGGFILTFVLYPIINTFTNAAFWTSETIAGARVTTNVAGMWEFWGAILLLALLSFVWVKTRQ